MTPRWRRVLFGLSLWLPLLLPGPAMAEKVTFHYDQKHDSLWMVRGAKSTPVGAGESVRVPIGSRLELEVDSTNTALYRFETQATVEESPDAAALRGIVPILMRYVPELGGQPPSFAIAPRETTEVMRELSTIDSCLDVLRGIRIAASSALQRMRETDRVEPEAKTFADGLKPQLTSDDPPQLLVRSRLIASLAKLGTLRLDRASASERKAARDALEATPAIMERLRSVEQLVAAVIGARSTWSRPIGTLPASKSLTVTLQIKPRNEPVLTSFARDAERKVSFGVEPRWPVRPNVGVGLLLSPGSTFPTLEIDRSGSTPTVVETGSMDSRITYGLSLALTPDGLYGRAHGMTYWLAELTLNPSDNVRAVGFGQAVSWGILKLSAGWLWTKHQSAAGAKIEETYGHPEGFVGLALAGWLE